MSADGDQRQDRHRGTPVHRAGRWRRSRCDAAQAALAQGRPATRGDRRRAVLLVHQLPADPVHGDLAVRPARACSRPTPPLTWSPPARACPTGSSEAARLLQEVDRPVLLVCAEKFSDKIGTVRPSRMIFGDGAAAMVIGPAADGRARRHRPTCRPTPAARSARSTRSSGRTRRSTTTSPSTGRRSRPWPAATWRR